MKTRNLVVGLTVFAALAAAIPAFAATHHETGGLAAGGGSRSGSASGARRDLHPHRGKREATSPAIPAAPFTAESLTATAEAELARSGQVVLPISFGGPGTVLATGEAAVGMATTTAIGTTPDGHSETVEVPRDFRPAIQPASVTATAAGTSDLTISLTAWAKSELAAGHDVEVILSLSPAQGASGDVPSISMFLELPGS
jgi:hypothetical protein